MTSLQPRPFPIIFALWAAGLGAAAQFGKVSILYDLLVAHYGGIGRVAFMVSVVGLVGLIFGTTAGIIVERLGLRRVLLVALAAGAVISAIQATLPSYPLMMASRIVEGLSHLAIVVVGPVLIAQTAPPRHQGFAMTLWSTFFGLSYALLALVGGWFITHGAGALFLAHSVYMATMTVVIWALLPPHPPVAARDLPQGGVLAQHVEIYRSPRIAAPATGFVFYTMLYVALLTLLPPMLGKDRVIAATVMPLLSIGVSLTLGVWLLKHLPAVRIVEGGFAVALGAAIVMGLSWGMPPVRLAAALTMTAALGMVQGASFASIPQLNPVEADRARASGAVAQLGNLGTTTGTPILAALVASFGSAGVVWFAAPLCAGGILMHAWQAYRRRRL